MSLKRGRTCLTQCLTSGSGVPSHQKPSVNGYRVSGVMDPPPAISKAVCMATSRSPNFIDIFSNLQSFNLHAGVNLSFLSLFLYVNMQTTDFRLQFFYNALSFPIVVAQTATFMFLYFVLSFAFGSRFCLFVFEIFYLSHELFKIMFTSPIFEDFSAMLFH